MSFVCRLTCLGGKNTSRCNANRHISFHRYFSGTKISPQSVTSALVHLPLLMNILLYSPLHTYARTHTHTNIKSQLRQNNEETKLPSRHFALWQINKRTMMTYNEVPIKRVPQKHLTPSRGGHTDSLTSAVVSSFVTDVWPLALISLIFFFFATSPIREIGHSGW